MIAGTLTYCRLLVDDPPKNGYQLVFYSYLQKDSYFIPDDKVPQPLVKHLSSVDVSGKYEDPEGIQAA